MKGMKSMKMMRAERKNILAALQKKEMTEGQYANKKMKIEIFVALHNTSLAVPFN